MLFHGDRILRKLNPMPENATLRCVSKNQNFFLKKHFPGQQCAPHQACVRGNKVHPRIHGPRKHGFGEQTPHALRDALSYPEPMSIGVYFVTQTHVCGGEHPAWSLVCKFAQPQLPSHATGTHLGDVLTYVLSLWSVVNYFFFLF